MERNLMKGNEALAEAALRAGCKCFFGYPITPQTEISAYLAKNMAKAGGEAVSNKEYSQFHDVLMDAEKAMKENVKEAIKIFVFLYCFNI